MRKRFYSFMLMAVGLLISGNAGATERTAGTIADLKSALSAAQDGDVIKLTADMTFSSTENTETAPNITKSITLDGQGYKISGYGIGENVNTKGYDKVDFKTTITINKGGSSKIDVMFKDVIIENTNGHSIDTHGNLGSLTMENCKVITNSRGLFIGGNQADMANITIKNTEFDCGSTGWAIAAYNPINLQMENSTTKGWNAVTFKGPWQPNNNTKVNNCEGSHGSTATLVNCNFDATNYLSGSTNAYAVFVLEDDDIDIHLTDCGMNTEALGDAQQVLYGPTDWNYVRTEKPIKLTIEGNNSHLNGQFYNDAATYYGRTEGAPVWTTEIVVKGGTYSEDPSKAKWDDPDGPETIEKVKNFVPEGYEVSTVTQSVEGKDPVTLYRVHPKAAKNEHGVAYKLNDNVESQGGGQNPSTSFILSEDETVTAEKTYAEYVEVNAGTITIPTGKALNVGEAGLVVKEGAQIVVEAGGVLTVSKGGAITAKDESIIVGADAINGAGSYLVDPVVTFNTKPLATVKMVANVGKSGNDYTWHRFAMPVEKLETPWTKVPNYGTLLYEWSYSKGDWDQTAGGSTGMKPFLGYTITTQQPVTDVEYTFTGNLLGNNPSEIDFQHLGYGYFGNSYTGYILAKEMLNGFKDVEGVEGQVWMWNAAQQSYTGVSLKDLWEREDRLADYEKEVAPMQTFILKTNTGLGATINIDYMKAIWGNPRYGLVEEPTAAPARYNAENEDNAFAKIMITAANGQSDEVRLTENDANEDAYENSVDATKYFNKNHINIYTSVEGEDYTSLYTNNLLDKEITLQTQNEVAYTLSVGYAEGGKYALQDMLTGAIIPLEQGTTYNFAAQSNTTSKRFRVVEARKVVTDIDNVEASRSAKGIYTVLGQYVGETSMFNTLPAGVYVIDGVKIIK